MGRRKIEKDVQDTTYAVKVPETTKEKIKELADEQAESQKEFIVRIVNEEEIRYLKEATIFSQEIDEIAHQTEAMFGSIKEMVRRYKVDKRENEIKLQRLEKELKEKDEQIRQLRAAHEEELRKMEEKYNSDLNALKRLLNINGTPAE